MKHAGPDALIRLSPLLEKLRARPALREKSPGVFYLKSRAFLHFHEDPSGMFADVRLDEDEDFTRLPASTASEQADLLERVDQHLSAILQRSPKSRSAS